MINYNENKAGNEKIDPIDDINRSRPRYGHKYTRYKIFQYNDDCMHQAIRKQHLKFNSRKSYTKLRLK